MVMAILFDFGRRVARAVIPLLPVLIASCGDTPRAPDLRNDPIYQNSEEGLRFRVPDGWSQFASARVPPGTATVERMLVEYMVPQSDRPATLRVTIIDLPATENIDDYLAGRPGEKWEIKSTAEPIVADGVPGTRTLLAAKGKTGSRLQEVYAFRRGPRVYLFNAILFESETKAQQQVRRMIESLGWKK
jgi:hypothetical protein